MSEFESESFIYNCNYSAKNKNLKISIFSNINRTFYFIYWISLDFGHFLDCLFKVILNWLIFKKNMILAKEEI